MKPRKHPEADAQIAIVQALRWLLPPDAVVYWVPNGSFLSTPRPGQLKFFTAMGVVAGVPDLRVEWPGGHGYIEIKAPKGKLTAAQREFAKGCKQRGIPCGIARNAAQACALVESWGVVLRGRIDPTGFPQRRIPGAPGAAA